MNFINSSTLKVCHSIEVRHTSVYYLSRRRNVSAEEARFIVATCSAKTTSSIVKTFQPEFGATSAR